MAFLQRPTIFSKTQNNSQPPPSPPSSSSSSPPESSSSSSPPPSEPQHPPPTPQTDPSWLSPRSLRQSSLFFAGALFMTTSIYLTRRNIRARHLAILPPRFTPSNLPPRIPMGGPVEAIEALSLATAHVTAFGIMLVGGLGWAFDVSSVEELRVKVRGGMGVDGTGRSEGEVEEEFEEWLATVLERKREKERGRRERGEGQGGRRWVNERGKER